MLSRHGKAADALEMARPTPAPAPVTAVGQEITVLPAGYPVPATPEETRRIEWLLRLTRDGTPVTQWPDEAKQATPALIRDAIVRQMAAMAGATVDEVRRTLAFYLSCIPDPATDFNALEAALASDLLDLMQIPRALLFMAHRRVRQQWHGGRTRLPSVADFRNAVATELCEMENHFRLLKQGFTRLHTAAVDWNDSERTRAAANMEREREWAEIRRQLGMASPN
jgi:hypothetical protein